ncbi:MAG: protein-disulfide isomerase [Lysobacterales bacterium]|jgi:protein-disulfide isomerase
MDNKFTTLLLVVVVGLLVGFGIVSTQNKNASLNDLVSSQKRIEAKLTGGGDSGNLAAVKVKQIDLEQRIVAIEKLIKDGPAAQPPRQQPPAEDLSKVHDIPVDHSILVGAKDAPITITEFVDFECPFCARFHGPVEEVLIAYPGKVNYMVKNFPLSFHPNAKPASKAAFAAGEQGKYGEMVVKLLDNGRNLNQATFEKLAGDLGLNVDKFKKDLKDNDAKYEGYIQKDIALGAKVGVRGTPTFFLNGKKTSARDLAGYKQAIDVILKK